MTNHSRCWITEARETLHRSDVDFFQVRASRYWFDFLLSTTVAYVAATIVLMAPLGSWQQLVSFPIAVFWLYRLGSLVHEVAHLQQYELRGFKVAWNLLAGVFLLTPSPFFTRHHRDHHSQRWYGTAQDPEYIVNVYQPTFWGTVRYSLLVLAFPVIVFLRFLLVPLTYLHPRLRKWVLVHATALTLNRRYERGLQSHDDWTITALEWLCWLRVTWIPVSVLIGAADWTRIPLLYSLGLSVFVLNQSRLLADHHFRSDGSQLDLDDHLRDSCNFTGRDWMTWLLFPFSIRYHALHHLAPTLPYHNLAAAHAYLCQHLPVDSTYRQLDQHSWWSVASKTLFSRTSPATT
jgi:fatty acid desaturase